MKKRALIILLTISLILILQINLVLSQVPENPYKEDINKIKEGKDAIDQLKEGNNSEFLKKQWGELLSKNIYMGPIFSFFNQISPITNPLFKYTLGLEPSFTFLFLLTLSIWIALVAIIFRSMRLLSIMSKKFHYIASFGFVIIVSILGLTRTVAGAIINSLEKLQTWWIKLIVLTIIIVTMLLSIIISKKIDRYAKKTSKTAEEDLAREKLKSSAEVAETFTKGITE